MFFTMKRSPGAPWVITVGITRESQQVMNSASGDWPCSASLRKSSLFSLQYCVRNRWIPEISFSIVLPPSDVGTDDSAWALGAGGKTHIAPA